MANRSVSSSSASFYEKPHEPTEENTLRLYAQMRVNMEETMKLTKELEEKLGAVRQDFAMAAALIGAIHLKKLASDKAQPSNTNETP